MRIRSTKPEFWRSERVASVSWDARLVLKGLESFVDDNGVGRDDLALIVGDLFQRDLVRDSSRTVARVSEALTELSGAGLLHRYEVDGTKLLYLSFWESFQRVDKPQPGRMPRPDGTYDYKESIIREPGANIREASRALAPGTGEQGNRGTEEQRRGGGATAPSPFCHHHPTGTDKPCKACANARMRFEATKRDEKSRPTPVPPRKGEVSGMCSQHPDYPLPCDRCERDRKAA